MEEFPVELNTMLRVFFLFPFGLLHQNTSGSIKGNVMENNNSVADHDGFPLECSFSNSFLCTGALLCASASFHDHSHCNVFNNISQDKRASRERF